MSGNVGTYIVTPQATTDYRLKVVDGSTTTITQAVRVTVAQATAAIGVNVLNPNPDNRAVMNAFLDAGCEFLLVIDDELAAIGAAERGATVLFRRWVGKQVPSPDDMAGRLKAAIHPNVICTGQNEADGWPNWSADDMKKRSEWDYQVAVRIHGMGGRYAGGTISVGNPAVPNSDVCAAIRQGYAPHYNSGLMAFDYHSYAPNMHPTDADWLYHSRRWEFFFTCAGFDPNVRAIYSGETGVDEGGIGGFKAHNATQDQMISLILKYIEVQSAPLVVGGMSYPSPFVAGAIFQASNSSQWAGYDVRGYMNALSATFWQQNRAADYAPTILFRDYVEGAEDINAKYWNKEWTPTK